jgi:hypothetical protein
LAVTRHRVISWRYQSGSQFASVFAWGSGDGFVLDGPHLAAVAGDFFESCCGEQMPLDARTSGLEEGVCEGQSEVFGKNELLEEVGIELEGVGESPSDHGSVFDANLSLPSGPLCGGGAEEGDGYVGAVEAERQGVGFRVPVVAEVAIGGEEIGLVVALDGPEVVVAVEQGFLGGAVLDSADRAGPGVEVECPAGRLELQQPVGVLERGVGGRTGGGEEEEEGSADEASGVEPSVEAEAAGAVLLVHWECSRVFVCDGGDSTEGGYRGSSSGSS